MFTTARHGRTITETSLGRTIGEAGAESSRQLQFQVPPGREVRPEMLITESLHAQNERQGQEADSAEWVPEGREGLQKPSAFSDQGRREQHEQ